MTNASYNFSLSAGVECPKLYTNGVCKENPRSKDTQQSCILMVSVGRILEVKKYIRYTAKLYTNGVCRENPGSKEVYKIYSKVVY